MKEAVRFLRWLLQWQLNGAEDVESKFAQARAEMDNEQYQVGHLTDIRDGDPVVNGWDAAMQEAERQSNEDAFDDRPIGIWQVMDGGHSSLDGIFYSGTMFLP